MSLSAIAFAAGLLTPAYASVDSDHPTASEINCVIFQDALEKGMLHQVPAYCGGTAGDGDSDGGNGGGGDGDGDGDGDTGGGSGDGDGDDGGGSTTPPPSGGNSGGPAPACEDNIDNDGDGLIDMNDEGCSEAADNDETNEQSASSSGGGGGGSGTSSVASDSTDATEPEEETAEEEEVIACDMYLTAFIRYGADNDEEQVKRLQRVLRDNEGAPVEENGTYDLPTLEAVRALQTKYASEILDPWGVEESTGYVYLTTRKKVNEIYCSTREFPLSEAEKEEIARIRSLSQQQNTAAAASVAPVEASIEAQAEAPSAETQEETVSEETVGANENESQTAAAPSAVSGPFERMWRPLSSFFSRVFGR
jgi:hypothetical protein